ncbi:hypothetical protein RND71_017407 [Anisodus tanguticus]|uniref:Large ribosomal subunit protein uL30-like ferredoxin-like fold domain-containing protein n=1 Tax=Anisodus tanguticus TaxID=243964 RepID=A0AAE1S429_9SOLA|nr:hypothetical protein RND71_017407 [Anisodus tanguticus]
MAEEVPQALNYIPEVILKKRKNNEEWAIRRKLQLEQKVKKHKSDNFAIKKPEQFIREKSDMHPRTRKLLYSLRLRKIFNGVFVKADARILEILQKVEPYVTYGYPNLKSIKDLLYKKGAGKIDNQRVPLTSNEVVEQALGQHGVLCLEDVVNEIANVGPHFKDVTSFLCPFALTKPEKALQGKKKRFVDGGDSGNREGQINELEHLSLAAGAAKDAVADVFGTLIAAFAFYLYKSYFLQAKALQMV